MFQLGCHHAGQLYAAASPATEQVVQQVVTSVRGHVGREGVKRDQVTGDTAQVAGHGGVSSELATVLRGTDLQFKQRYGLPSVGHKRINPRPATSADLLPDPGLFRVQAESRKQWLWVELHEVAQQISDVHFVRQDSREGLKTGPELFAARHELEGTSSSPWCCLFEPYPGRGPLLNPEFSRSRLCNECRQRHERSSCD